MRVARRRDVAWPTIGLAVVCVATFVAAMSAAVLDVVPWWAAFVVNTAALYALYIVMHDASHGAVMPRRAANEWLGRISVFLINPLFSFPAYRFIHMQHHRFTNERRRDPDMYVAGKNVFSQFFRCFTSDVGYTVYYLKSWNDRPVRERVESGLATVVGIAAMVAVAVVLGPEALILGWLLPSRVATGFLAFGLALLPHWPHAVEQRRNLYRASAVRLGWEPIMTPLLLYQNFHLVHHVLPSAPFYQARAIWYDNLEFFMSQNPVVKAFPSTSPPPTPASLANAQVPPPPDIPRELRR